jgi:hypothetical protein
VFIDPKTVSKVIFIRGDVSPGSRNDETLTAIIGSHWRELTGATQPVHIEGCSPGYQHDEFWPQLMERVTRVQEREREKEKEKEDQCYQEQQLDDSEKGNAGEVCDGTA